MSPFYDCLVQCNKLWSAFDCSEETMTARRSYLMNFFYTTSSFFHCLAIFCLDLTGLIVLLAWVLCSKNYITNETRLNIWELLGGVLSDCSWIIKSLWNSPNETADSSSRIPHRTQRLSCAIFSISYSLQFFYFSEIFFWLVLLFALRFLRSINKQIGISSDYLAVTHSPHPGAYPSWTRRIDRVISSTTFG
jgi:hypothetical protein